MSPPRIIRRGAVTYMGTVKLDVSTQLSEHHFRRGNDIYEVAPVVTRVGGTAVNFARAASGLFRELNIVGAIGDDGLTEPLLAAVNATCTSSFLQRCSGQSNAVVITVRDAADVDGRRSRLLISADQSPHTQLTCDHIFSCRGAIEASDFFVCDGYSLQHPTSTAALLAALGMARQAGVGTVLDLVPHNLPSKMSKRHVLPAIESSDIIVAEARTVVGLNEERWPVDYESDALLIDRALDASRIMASSAIWILRHGFENIGDTTVLRPDGSTSEYCTTYQHERETSLFGDRLLANELHSLLTSHNVVSSLVPHSQEGSLSQ